jgi:hypothetical protein
VNLSAGTFLLVSAAASPNRLRNFTQTLNEICWYNSQKIGLGSTVSEKCSLGSSNVDLTLGSGEAANNY